MWRASWSVKWPLLMESHIARHEVKMEEKVTARTRARMTEGASRVSEGEGRVLDER